MFVVHGTRKLLDRLKRPVVGSAPEASTVLGNWYATVLFWRPQAALFVNESTLLPVLMPLAPAATAVGRFPEAVAEVLRAHGVDDGFVEREVAEMAGAVVAKTANRSVVGVMNEFSRLAEFHREDHPDAVLLGVSLWLAQVPCGPLFARRVSPDRELAAAVAGHARLDG